MTSIENIIAQGLTQLVAAVNANTLALQNGAPAAATTPEPVAPKAAAAAKPSKPAPEPAAPKPAPDLGLRQIQDLGMRLIKDGKQAQVKEILKTHGAETFVQLPAASHGAVKEQLEALLQASPAGAAPASPKPAVAPSVTMEQVKAVAAPLLAREGDVYKTPKAVAAIRALLVTYKVAKISELAAADLPAFYTDLKSVAAAQTTSEDDLS